MRLIHPWHLGTRRTLVHPWHLGTRRVNALTGWDLGAVSVVTTAPALELAPERWRYAGSNPHGVTRAGDALTNAARQGGDERRPMMRTVVTETRELGADRKRVSVASPAPCNNSSVSTSRCVRTRDTSRVRTSCLGQRSLNGGMRGLITRNLASRTYRPVLALCL